jgi:hypothetical protein
MTPASASTGAPSRSTNHISHQGRRNRNRRLLSLLGSDPLNEIANLDAERICNGSHRSQGNVSLAPLNGSDVGPVYSRPIREHVLRPAFRRPKGSHGLPNRS